MKLIILVLLLILAGFLFLLAEKQKRRLRKHREKILDHIREQQDQMSADEEKKEKDQV